MKAILMSIRPEWCDLIIRGQKTLEVRRTKPGNLKTPFKCYVYCTKSKSKIGWLLIVPGKGWKRLDGNIIGEFTCDGIRRIGPEYCVVKEDIESAVAGSCLSIKQVKKYAGWDIGMNYSDMKDLYGWHISDLKIYDRPRPLSAFARLRATKFGYEPVDIERPPQSWFYVEDGR